MGKVEQETDEKIRDYAKRQRVVLPETYRMTVLEKIQEGRKQMPRKPFSAPRAAVAVLAFCIAATGGYGVYAAVNYAQERIARMPEKEPLPEAVPNSSPVGESSWVFQLEADDTLHYMEKNREKQDNSKIYFNWQSSFGGDISELIVVPYGANSADETPSPAGNLGTIREYRITAKGEYSITNHVKELGYSYANIGVKSGGGYGSVTGLWSPDSTENYTVPK